MGGNGPKTAPNDPKTRPEMGWNPQWDPSVGSGGDATPKRPHNGPKMTPKWGQLQLVRHGVDLEPIQPVGEKRRQKPQNGPKSPQNGVTIEHGAISGGMRTQNGPKMPQMTPKWGPN